MPGHTLPGTAWCAFVQARDVVIEEHETLQIIYFGKLLSRAKQYYYRRVVCGMGYGRVPHSACSLDVINNW